MGRQVTLNLFSLLKIQILTSFSYEAFIFTHFPIILREKKFLFIGTLTCSICTLAAIILQLVAMECQKLHMVDSPTAQNLYHKHCIKVTKFHCASFSGLHCCHRIPLSMSSGRKFLLGSGGSMVAKLYVSQRPNRVTDWGPGEVWLQSCTCPKGLIR